MKPMDALGEAVDKEVVVKIKNGMEIYGKLKAFDIHVNVVLENARFKDGDVEKKFSKMFIRGDTIIFIS